MNFRKYVQECFATERGKIVASLYVMTAFSLFMWTWLIVKGRAFEFTAKGASASATMLAYVVAALFFIAGYKIVFTFFPHALKARMGFLPRVFWLVVLTLWPGGPIAYYLMVFKLENECGGETSTDPTPKQS